MEPQVPQNMSANHRQKHILCHIVHCISVRLSRRNAPAETALISWQFGGSFVLEALFWNNACIRSSGKRMPLLGCDAAFFTNERGEHEGLQATWASRLVRDLIHSLQWAPMHLLWLPFRLLLLRLVLRRE
jgi:hypothetical protein